MKFLIDRCAGRRLAEWLVAQGHDAVEARTLGPDPGDQPLLELAGREGRVLVTLDNDFGTLIYKLGVVHAGLIRLPDVPVVERVQLMKSVIERHASDLALGAVVTVRGTRIRVSRSGEGG